MDYSEIENRLSELKDLVNGLNTEIRSLTKELRKHRPTVDVGSKISATKRSRRAKGYYVGGKVPFGYNVINGKLVINDTHVDAITIMEDMRIAGKSYRVIAEEIKEYGVELSYNGVRKVLSDLKEAREKYVK
jgi:hypothetical protein